MDYLLVKNWHEFQHYKERLPPWIKLHTACLTDYGFCKLPDESKAHLMLLWLLASQMDGRLPNDPQFLRERISAKKPINLAALIESGWLLVESATGLGESPKEDRQSQHSEQHASTALADRKHAAVVPLALARSRETEAETYKASEAETTSAARAVVPHWLPPAVWQDFVTFRKSQKGWTAKAEVLLLRDLAKLKDAGNEPVAVIEQSIANGWKGLFPLKSDRGGVSSKQDRNAKTIDGLCGNAIREFNEHRTAIDGDATRVG